MKLKLMLSWLLAAFISTSAVAQTSGGPGKGTLVLTGGEFGGRNHTRVIYRAGQAR
jgi:hypothetical protein